jgi:hypothetical protein
MYARSRGLGMNTRVNLPGIFSTSFLLRVQGLTLRNNRLYLHSVRVRLCTRGGTLTLRSSHLFARSNQLLLSAYLNIIPWGLFSWFCSC